MVHVGLVYIGVKKVDVCSVYMRIKKKEKNETVYTRVTKGDISRVYT